MGMKLDNIGSMASPMAQSIFAYTTGTNLPALLIGGAVAGGIIAAAFGYEEYKAYEEKKHLERITHINELYKVHLKRISIPILGEVDGFPPIFRPLNNNKFDYLHYTLDQIEDIGKTKPIVDEALDGYQESICGAIRKLQEYHYEINKDSHKSDSDVINLLVIEWLLNIISTKCLSFMGYDLDIAYLGALTQFVNAYSGKEHTRHFDRLSVVYSELLEAKQKLERHKEALSLSDTVTGLKHQCKKNSDLMIRTLVKMVAREENTALADTVNHNELSEGMLRRHYINTELLKIELKADNQINLPDSIFRGWIINLSKYYLSSLSSNVNKSEGNSSSNIDFYSFVTKAETYLNNKSAETSDKAMKELKKEVKGELKLVGEVFDKSGNFTSTVYSDVDKKFHIVKDDAQLIARTKVIANFAKLTDDVISLQYLSIHLSKSIKQLGEIYVKDPTHFRRIFRVVNKLCALIQKDLKTCQADFIALEEQNKDKMQDAKRGVFPSQVDSILKSVSAGIDHWSGEVNKCRRKAKDRKMSETMASANYEMLAVAKSIFKRYFSDKDNVSSGLGSESESKSGTHKHKHHHHRTKEQPVKEGASVEPNSNTPPATTTTPVVNKPATDTVGSSTTEPQSLNKLTKTIEIIHNRINEMSQENPKEATNYSKIYSALAELRKKSTELHFEKNKSQERFTKASKTLELSIELAEKTVNFLVKTTADRKESKVAFAQDIHELLNDADNCEYIDAHYRYLSRLITNYTNLCGFSIFNTDTRQKFNQFELAFTGLEMK